MKTYIPKGVCSKKITYSIEGNIVKKVNFLYGCPGNLEGISKLVEGMTIEEVICKLRGIKCGPKTTSCPDQLSKALEEGLNELK